MRIGITSTFPPYRGGIAQFNDAMARALEQAGHEVQCMTWSRQYPALLFPGKTQFEPGKSIADASMPATLDSLSPISWKRVGQDFGHRHNVDLLLLPFWHAALAPALTSVATQAKRQGVRQVIAVMHNANSHDGKAWEAALTRRFLQACDRVVTLSGSVSAKLQAWTPKTLFHPLYEHFPKGPTPTEARRQLGIAKEDVAHLFFGLIRPYKGLGVLLEALGRLPSHHKLLVAGECYEDWSSYQALINQHQLQERVQLHLEFIPDNLVPVFMQACDDVVLPYLNASQSGVTALALHHEKRVVASDVGDLGTSIVPNLTGRLVPPGQPEALAEALSTPWHAQPADQAMAFKTVKQKFSWSAWANQLTQLVQSEAQ